MILGFIFALLLLVVVSTSILAVVMIVYQGITGKELPKPQILKRAEEQAAHKKAAKKAKKILKKADEKAKIHAETIRILEEMENSRTKDRKE